MTRKSNWQKKQQVEGDVQTFFNGWNQNMKFPNEESLQCLAIPQFRELFSTIKNNRTVKKDPSLNALCSSNSSSK